jgi:predicted metal-dependent hydrolase
VFDADHLRKIEPGLRLFNEQKYWECHEALEDLWMEDRQDPVRNVYWAVIQVAAVCIHYRDGNLVGCRGMIAKAKEKFGRCRDLLVASDLLRRELQWDDLEALVLRIPDFSRSQLADFAALFDFRFKNFLD